MKLQNTLIVGIIVLEEELIIFPKQKKKQYITLQFTQIDNLKISILKGEIIYGTK